MMTNKPFQRWQGGREQLHDLPMVLTVGAIFHIGGRQVQCVGVHAHAATGTPVYEVEGPCGACGRFFRIAVGRAVLERGELPTRCLRHGRSINWGATAHAWRAEPSRIVRRAADELFSGSARSSLNGLGSPWSST